MATYIHTGTLPLIIEKTETEPLREIQPGETFEADLSPEQEAFWRKVGAIADKA